MLSVAGMWLTEDKSDEEKEYGSRYHYIFIIFEVVFYFTFYTLVFIQVITIIVAIMAFVQLRKSLNGK